VQIDTSNWSGEGEFTQRLIDRLGAFEEIAFVRVEDAPSTRSEADFNFISNEVFVAFATRDRHERARWFGFIPASRMVAEKLMTLEALERRLSDVDDIGPPDYADAGMLQFLRTERVVPPYQTRGYKIIELVRIYEANQS
jgi:hypothetical protein